MFVASETPLLIDKGVVIPYKILLYRALSGRNSAVECQLPKLDVTGSIPVARSNFFTFKAFKWFKSFNPFSESTILQAGFLIRKSKVSLELFEVLTGLKLLMQSGNLQKNKVSKNQFESNKRRSRLWLD